MRDLLPQVVDLPVWAVLSGPLMFVLFSAIIAWVYRRGGKKDYDQTKNLPLEDEDRSGDSDR